MGCPPLTVEYSPCKAVYEGLALSVSMKTILLTRVQEFGNFIFKNSSAYLHPRPRDYPAHIKWPGVYTIVDNLAEMARLAWPPYVSPTLFPDKETLPAALAAVAPLTSTAHPLITSLSCATLHPA